MPKESLLSNLPAELRQQLLDEFNKLVDDFKEARWESSEMSGGKLCEIVYTILLGHLSGNMPDKHDHGPRDLKMALTNLESSFPTTLGRPARIQIPRILIGVYELRNNRGVGHAGGDVKPNHMDAVYILSSAKWVMAELIRLFNGLGSADAQECVELLTDREVPLIWNIGTQKRVLQTNLTKIEETLVLLYSVSSATEQDLCEWVEYSSLSMYRTRIIVPGHKQRLWEYNTETGLLTLSSLGSARAEEILTKLR